MSFYAMSRHVPDEVLREVPGPEVLQPPLHQLHELPAVAAGSEGHHAGLEAHGWMKMLMQRGKDAKTHKDVVQLTWVSKG